MALAISLNQTVHRNDSTRFPQATISGYDETPFIKLSNWQYFKTETDVFYIFPSNRSLKDCPVILRDCKFDGGNWTKDAPSGDFSIATTDTGFSRSGGDTDGSWKGAYYDDALTGDIITVQAKATSINLSTGISLQDSPFTSHDYFSADVAHSIIFGQNGQLSIFELGIKPASQNVDFRYEVGDVGMIELDNVNGIVRYYLVKPDNSTVLLRTTRSKLTTDPVAEAMLYFPDSELEDVFICDGSEAVTTFENIGVARLEKGVKEWQKWGNQRSRVSNANPIQLADGEFAFTFPSSKRTLRQLSLTPKTFNNGGFQDFEDFFNWHGNEKTFIFVDQVRKDALGNPQEFWARFGGPMTDTSKNACLFDYGVPVVEVNRSDYIPRVLDVVPPSITLTPPFASPLVELEYTATDIQQMDYVRLIVNGVQFGDDIPFDGDNIYTFIFNTNTPDAGDYTIYAIAVDVGGNEVLSETITIQIADITSNVVEDGDQLIEGGDNVVLSERSVSII